MTDVTTWQVDVLERLRDQLGDDGTLRRQIVDRYLERAPHLLTRIGLAAAHRYQALLADLAYEGRSDLSEDHRSSDRRPPR
jgi:hypothetical protein